MDQERRIFHGHHSPRADIVVWQTVLHKSQGKSPCLIVECKEEAVQINVKDYFQGESYARASGSEFLVAHNRRYTGVFKLIEGIPGDIVAINEIPKAADWGDAKRIQDIKDGLRAFNRREFQNLLFECHTILRDVHKMEPGVAFDTISKVLFIKMFIERSGLHGTFKVDFIDRRAATMVPGDAPVHEQLFNQTKQYYSADDLFASSDILEISETTFRRIVGQLERFDLSRTSDDVKGIAFERFLGTTFRGELGQHFTPRPVVEFMIDVLDPVEGETICDPASGSGGFLIRGFEYVRDQIDADVQLQKDNLRKGIEACDNYSDEEKATTIAEAFRELNRELLSCDHNNRSIDTRVGRLAWNCIFGCDAEHRAARTSKMNMIMHGDGHGGIHYHDGLVDIDGIAPGRFDIVATNPPFGSNVGSDQKVGGSEQASVSEDPAYQESGRRRYGDEWLTRHRQLLDSKSNGQKILDLYEIGRSKNNRPTEALFVERSLSLLKAGGRLGIVLPDGNLNNPSLAWLRRWCEGKARILAVISLPENTFQSSQTTAKTSIVFMRKFTPQDEDEWEAAWQSAHKKHDATFNAERQALCDRYSSRIPTGENEEIAEVLSVLATHGVTRCGPSWVAGPTPVYPRGIGVTKIITNSKWIGGVGTKQNIRALKKEYSTLFKSGADKRSRELLAQLRREMKKLDEHHNRALWASVRELFDYPVFVASPTSVGVSVGVDEVPNELPAIRDAYREFVGQGEGVSA